MIKIQVFLSLADVPRGTLMKSVVFTIILASSYFISLTGCKKEIDHGAYLKDPNYQKALSELASAEKELKTIEDLFLDAKKKYFDAKSSLADTYDLAENYYIYKEKLEQARSKYLYYNYKIKYERFSAQERYLRSTGLQAGLDSPSQQIDKDK